jgi:arylsulfatase A-like enzyme
MNVLLVTLDQLRGDVLGCAGHPLGLTPNLDRLAARGVHLARHFSQAAPCAPGRASLYTGRYQMNHRVVANGTPLPRGLDNVALLARRAGFVPALFGYTDQGIDPAEATGPDDPRLERYDGLLPGFEPICWLPDDPAPWVEHLAGLGVDIEGGARALLATEDARDAELSLAAYLTDSFLAWHATQEGGWFAHLSYLRPHPPYVAAGRFSTLVDPADVGRPIEPAAEALRHPLHSAALELEAAQAPVDDAALRRMRAQYLGSVAAVDHEVGRVLAHLEAAGQLEETLVILTSDHGEQLGDHGLKEKLGFFPQSYHVPCLWVDPAHPEWAGRRIEAFTENVDVLPSLAVALGQQAPAEADGRILQELFADPGIPWRASAHWEWDWRDLFISSERRPWPYDRTLATMNLATTLTDDVAYVRFADGSHLCFDLAADPTWRTTTEDPALLLEAMERQLDWRQVHLRRELTDLLLRPGRPGRWPGAGG